MPKNKQNKTMAEVKQNRFDSAELVNRFDFGASQISKTQVTSQGFLKIPAVLTRTGVLTYNTSDGKKVRELRHPEDVNLPESLSTLQGAPVITGNHEMVNPNNVNSLQAGFVSGAVEAANDLVNSSLTVQRADAIEDVRAKRLREISPGYACNIEVGAGVYKGQKYDQRQRNIKYNHVLLLPPGAGRSGPQVSLRGDDAFSLIEDDSTKAPSADKETRAMKKIKIRLDGIVYQIEVADELAASFENAVGKLEQERGDATSELAKFKGRIEVLEQERNDAKAELLVAQSPEALNKAAAVLATVMDKAKKMAPEMRFDGKSLDEIRKEALCAAGKFKAERLDSADSGFIEGAFEAATVAEDDAPEPKPRVPGVTFKRGDSKKEDTTEIDPYDSAAAHERMLVRNREMYKS